MSAPDSFGSPDGRTYSTPETAGQAAPSADELLNRAADALWDIAKAALTVEHSLDKPYDDDPRWSPWTRWVERPARRAHDTAMAIRKHLRTQAAIAAAAPATAAPVRRPRLRGCVEAWPECVDGDYNPACCRFPKSCSCASYDDECVTPEILEDVPHPQEPQPQAAPELAAAMAERDRLRYGIERAISHLEESAKATSPSKKSAIEVAVAGRLRALLEDAGQPGTEGQ